MHPRAFVAPTQVASMDIRFISSLTAEDENRLAPTVMDALTKLLDGLPIAYTLRIETSDATVYHRTESDLGPGAPARRPQS